MDLPRERLLRLGPQALSTKELLAILIGSGTAEHNVFAVADRIAQHNLATLTLKQLQQIPGVGLAKACTIVAALALAQHTKPTQKITITNPKQVAKLLAFLKAEQQEHFYGIFLNTRKQLITYKLLFKGTVDTTVVHPRDIFRTALELNASSIILAHNHPSGEPEPSDEDIVFTKQLVELGETLHIPVLDHVIIGDTFWSFVQGEV